MEKCPPSVWRGRIRNIPLLQLKKKKKKEKKNTKTFTFTTLLNHVILRDDQPILMIDLQTI